MTTPGEPTAAQLSQHAVESVLHDFTTLEHRGLVVDSPPGAGKSTLVVAGAAAIAERGEPCMIVAQTNNQVDDLVRRLAAQHPRLRLGRLSAGEYNPTAPLLALRNLRIDSNVADLGPCDVVIATAAKWMWVRDFHAPWAILDEAYQMRSDLLLLVADKFDRGLFVGDPGQLDPFTIVETPRWIGLPYDPTQSAVAVLLNHNPDLPVRRLPISWRLPASAAPVVSQAFYPFLGFHAGTQPHQRRLEYATAGFRSPVDATLDQAARTGWALHELPPRHVPRTDPQAAQAVADIAARLLARRAVATCEREPDGLALRPEHLAVGVAHRDQADQIRRMLEHSNTPGADQITVDTANRLQGREFEVTVLLHPLSGRRDATNFHLEAGRLCVLASRHRHACIVVARGGITDLLDNHPSTEPVHLNVRAKFPDGWEANQTLLTHLATMRNPA